MTMTAKGKNAALTGGFTNVATHAGLMQKQTPLTAVTATGDTFTKTAHGLANGDIVKVSGLTGGDQLVAGRIYFVRDTAANTFKLALVPGGGSGEQAAVSVGTNVTAATVTEYVELTGGSPAYSRVTNSWNAPSGGSVDNNVVGADVNVPAAATVDAICAFSAISSGDLLDLSDVTAEGPYGAQGLYQITDYDVHLNAAL